MKHLTNTELESRTAVLIKEERRISADLLLHFREIEIRRIFAERGFSSMFEYLVKGHGYSEGRRTEESWQLDRLKLVQKLKLGFVMEKFHYLRRQCFKTS